MYIEMKRKLGYKYESQLSSFILLDKSLIESDETGPGISKKFADAWYVQRTTECDKTRYNRSLILREFCGFLANLNIPTYCPRPPRYPKNDYIPYVFTHEEINKLLMAIDQVKVVYHKSENGFYCMPVIIRILYGTGLRIGELLSLKDEDIDFSEKTILVRDSKNGLQRLIPYSQELNNVMLNYKRYRDSVLSGFNEPKAFLVNFKGERLNRSFVEVAFRLCLRLAKIPYLGVKKGPRVHSLRHTFACHSLAKMCHDGMDIYVSIPILATYLGHKSLDSINAYVRLTQDMFPYIMEQIDKTCLNVYPIIRNIDETI